MKGDKLQKLITTSRKRKRAAQQLVFSGYDGDGKTINGRPFDKGETFRIATTRFLAQGGDGYMKGMQFLEPGRGRLTLRGLTQEAIRHGGALPWARRPRGRNAWKTRWENDISLSYTDEQGFGDAEDGDFETSVGLDLERNFPSAETQLGVEVVPEYGFELEAEIFYAAVERRLSIDNQNTLEIELPGDLKLTADADSQFEWDEEERSLESELQVGLGIGYEWEGRLAR